jgi:hypothetical protein
MTDDEARWHADDAAHDLTYRNVDSLPGVDWANDSLFFTHEWEDETSQFDPQGRWQGGSECYLRTFKARVPVAFRDCDELIEMFTLWVQENCPGCEGFWVD